MAAPGEEKKSNFHDMSPLNEYSVGAFYVSVIFEKFEACFFLKLLFCVAGIAVYRLKGQKPCSVC